MSNEDYEKDKVVQIEWVVHCRVYDGVIPSLVIIYNLKDDLGGCYGFTRSLIHSLPCYLFC